MTERGGEKRGGSRLVRSITAVVQQHMKGRAGVRGTERVGLDWVGLGCSELSWIDLVGVNSFVLTSLRFAWICLRSENCYRTVPSLPSAMPCGS